MQVEKEDKNKYQETFTSRLVFRVITFLCICGFCFLVIHLEFISLKKNENSREYAMQLAETWKASIGSLQDAWNTMYYFYQTGDLLKIMRCPSITKTSVKNRKNTLLMLYRENIETQKTIQRSEDMLDENYNKNWPRCGGLITINIGLKEEVYNKPNDSKKYTFILGDEPKELVEKYPFVKYALSRLKEGEKATFVAMPETEKIYRLQKQTIYEISIPSFADNNITNLPLYIAVEKNEEKFAVDEHVFCGSIVKFLYKIQSINGKILYEPDDFSKIKIGDGKLQEQIEQVMSHMSVGDRYKIFLTKDMIKDNEFLPKNKIGKEDMVIFDVKIVNVQK